MGICHPHPTFEDSSHVLLSLNSCPCFPLLHIGSCREPPLGDYPVKRAIEFTGFAAVTTREPDRPVVKLRSEVFAFQCKEIDRCSSGCALVNSDGEVMGFTTMCSGLHGSKKVNCDGVSVQEIHHLINQKSRTTPAAQTLTGRWVGKFEHAPAEMGVEFKANGQVSFIIPGGGKIAGLFRLNGNNLQVTTAGKKETMQLEWLDGHSFKQITPQFTSECKRHKGGLQQGMRVDRFNIIISYILSKPRCCT